VISGGAHSGGPVGIAFVAFGVIAAVVGVVLLINALR
jgi:hypothetical protein